MRFLPLLFSLSILTFPASAQKGAIGQWQAHYPFNSVTGIATDGEVLYAASSQGFFSYKPSTGEMITHSKVDGMSDAGTDKIGYDTLTETVVLTYQNGNIDLYKGGSFYNIPSLRLRPSTGAKTVADVYCVNGVAYISTSLGTIVLDLKKQEVRENYVFYNGGDLLPMNAVRIFGSQIYAATSLGLYRAPLSGVNLQDFASWQLLLSGNVEGLTVAGSRLWLSTSEGVLRYNDGTAPDTVFRSTEVVHIDPSNNGLIISQVENRGGYILGRVRILDTSGRVLDSFATGVLTNTLQLNDTAFYSADNWAGLRKRTTEFDPPLLAPPGPQSPSNFRIVAHDRKVRVLHGSYNLLFQPVGRGGWISNYDGSTDKWKLQPPFTNDATDLIDYVETNAGAYYGSMRRGLFLQKKDSTVTDFTAALEPNGDDASGFLRGVMSMTEDLDGNLIVGQYKAITNELAILQKSNGQWTHLSAPGSAFVGGLARTAAGLLTDDYGNLWWFQPQGGGVFVYDMNHTPANPADDKSKHLTKGKGSGGLSSPAVLSMTKDLDGSIWIGTDDGMAVINCPGSVISGTCEATQPIVKLDQFAGLLFDKERVNTIAVDGANRKWVGTNNGVWLLSPDAQQVIERFTVDNSPLPTNVVQRIAVDDVTGDVYIGTSNGLMSYRGTATAGSETEQTVRIFPNPVRSNYRGTIAFANLPTNADVRITDISGQLLYRTTANGGQATWNGMDYTGKRPQTGVYLVFVTSKDGTVTTKGKFVFAE